MFQLAPEAVELLPLWQPSDPCKALMAAVLWRASEDAIGISEPQLLTPYDKRQAKAWFYTPDIFICSYYYICQILDFDPVSYRKALFSSMVTLGRKRTETR